MKADSIPTIIRELRQEYDLTQEQFAQRVGVTCSTVNRWENGQRQPQPYLIRRLEQMKQNLEAGPASLLSNPESAETSGGDDWVTNTGSKPESNEHAVRSQISRMVDRIVERFQPERIMLFGSHARGEGTLDSDVDLLVVMPVSGSKREAQLRLREALRDIPVPKDVIVTTPEDFAWRKEVAGTIERPASRTGKVLYARS
jgi:uncharacterized protein